MFSNASFLKAQPAMRPIEFVGDDRIPQNLSLFELRFRDLLEERRSYVAIEDAAGALDERGLDFLVSAIGTNPMIVLAQDDRARSLFRSRAPHVEWLNDPNALITRLIKMPSPLWQNILLKTRSDFDEELFARSYQDRAATIVNPGNASWLTTGSRISMPDFFGQWSNPAYWTNPLLLLGNRGAGKTWELLHFVKQQAARHEEFGWSAAAPLYMPLANLRRFFDSSGVQIRSVSQLLAEQYPEIQLAFGNDTLTAFFDTGHIIACLDGVDEILVSPADDQVGPTFWRLLSEASSSARLVLTARDGHFRSIKELLKLRVWDSGTVADQFTVLSISAFDNDTIRSAARRVSRQKSLDIRRELLANFDNETIEKRSVGVIIEGMLSHPAILARLAAIPGSPQCLSPSNWANTLFSVINRVLVSYNLEQDKAGDVFETSDHESILLGEEARHLILEEFAQAMATRAIDRLDPELIAAKLNMLIGADSPRIVGEFRVQTVLELARDDNNQSNELQFGIRIEQGRQKKSDEAGFGRLNDEALESAPVGVTSVSGAFYLAKWVFRRLDLPKLRRASDTQDLSALEELLSILGLFPLGPLAGAVLEGFVRDREGVEFEAAQIDLSRIACTFLHCLARDGHLRVFSPRLRYLAHNLQAAGVWSSEERERWDPWNKDVAAIVTPATDSCPRMILVPPVQDGDLLARIGDKLEADGVNDCRALRDLPYLLGVSEVTNAEFVAFLKSREGSDWRVERVTRAASDSRKLSKKAGETNEYHLYHWRHSVKEGFLPSTELLDHPVTYVSWFAANAYCDWLSKQARKSNAKAGEIVYRLPTSAEWFWVAKGGFGDVDYPWDLYGGRHGALIPSIASDLGDARLRGLMDVDSQRERIKRLIEGETKETRSVGMELLPSFGAFGLVGNVKEWVYDRHLTGAPRSNGPVSKPDPQVHRVIVGGSSNLGEVSYRFDYFSFLFPENTNPDVGFRVCRQLNETEVRTLRARELDLASVVPD